MRKTESSRFHADRAAGGDRHHRRPDRPALAGRAVGPRGGPPRPVHQQPQADRPGPAQLPHGHRHVPDGRLEEPPLGPGDTDWHWGYGRWTGWSARRCCWATWSRPRCTTRPTSTSARRRRGMIGSSPNSTVYNPSINSFLCPSDPNAGRIAATATTRASARPPTRAPSPPRGCSRSGPSYGIRDCTDGTSNTIAFAEALTGRDNASFVRRRVTSPGRRLPGRHRRERHRPRHRRPGIGRPPGLLRNECPVSQRLGQLGRGDRRGSRRAPRPGATRPPRRIRRCAGSAGPTATAAGPTPTSSRRPTATAIFPGGGCRFDCAGCGIDSSFSYARVEQPPGRGEHPDGRRQRPVRQGQRVAAHLVGPRHPQRRRGHQRR